MTLSVCQCNYKPVTVNIVLVKLMQQNLTITNAGSLYLPLLKGKYIDIVCRPESNVIRFTVVKEWPLAGPGMLEKTKQCFFFPSDL